MKAARIVVLTVAIAAGGVAAMLAGRSDPPPAPKVEVPKFDTVDILVAKADIPRGQVVTPADVYWQAWPQTTASGNFIRKTDRPKAVENLNGMIVRTPFVAGEPIREAKLVNSKGSGFMAAILPPGMRAISTQISPETGAGGFILPNDRVDVILTPRGNRDAGVSGNSSETICATFGFSRSIKLSKRKTARRSSSARLQHLSFCLVRRKRWRCRSNSARWRCHCAALPTILPVSQRQMKMKRAATSTSSASVWVTRPRRDD